MDRSKKHRADREQTILDGLQKNLRQDATMAVAGAMLSLDEISARVAPRIEATNRVAAARRALVEALDAERQALVETQRFMADLIAAISVVFGASIALADCGIAPRRPRRALTAIEKLRRNARVEATRKLRHTMGPRERERVKASGAVSIVIVPPTDATPPEGGERYGP
jgi:hypothetical protein